jgi:hypothetical protein
MSLVVFAGLSNSQKVLVSKESKLLGGFFKLLARSLAEVRGSWIFLRGSFSSVALTLAAFLPAVHLQVER